MCFSKGVLLSSEARDAASIERARKNEEHGSRILVQTAMQDLRAAALLPVRRLELLERIMIAGLEKMYVDDPNTRRFG
jgi:hypothetical protein